MDPELHRRAGELFLELCDLPAGEAEARLGQRCAGEPELRLLVAGMLASDRRGGAALEGHAADLLAWGPPSAPLRIGTYRVVGELGRGGMGVVYEAEQESPRRRVALKVLRPGLTSESHVLRFEHEASLLAWLNHPGIAQIYEAGVAEGPHGPQPYFALELVRGVPLTRYCRRHGLDLRARLELLAAVCDAVHHAHQKGVIHRDLKPANILVDEQGRPKVLDFGVARAAAGGEPESGPQTRAGDLLGTLAYMSPEQLGGDPGAVDARSDIHALGVIGYELVTGRLPIDPGDKPLPDAIVALANEDAPRVRSVAPQVPEDVETILAKALEKARERRYPSAAALGEDLRRFLSDLPIAARPPTAIYQLSKFSRRNRALVGGIAAAALLLVAGTLTSTLLYLDAEAARRREQREAATAQEVSAFLSALFEGANPLSTEGEPLTAAQLLQRGTERIAASLRERPQVRAHLLAVIGRAQTAIGNPAAGEELLEESLELWSGLAGQHGLDRLRALRGLAAAVNAQGRADEALRVMDEAMALARSLDGEPEQPELVGTLLCEQGTMLLGASDYVGARELLEAGIAALESAGGPPTANLADHWAALAGVLDYLDERAQADEAWKRAREVHEALYPGDDPRKARFLGHLSQAELARGRPVEALALQRDALAMTQRTWGEPHDETAREQVNLARVLLRLGRAEEAEVEARAAVAGYRALTASPDEVGLALAQGALASILRELGRPEEAEEHARAAVEIYVRKRGPHHAGTLTLRQELAQALQSRGALEEALEEFRRCGETQQVLHGPADPRSFQAWAHVGTLLRRLGRTEEALELLGTQAELARSARGAADVSAVVLSYQLAYTLKQAGRLEEAERELGALVPHRRGDPLLPPRYGRAILRELAEICEAQERGEEAHAWRTLLSQESQ